MKRFCLLAGIVFLSAPVASFAGTVDNWSCYTNDGTTYAALVASAALSETPQCTLVKPQWRERIR